MILFQKDYNLYKGYHINTDTDNESFLKIASLFKDMGIKNWMFPLVLHQKDLVGVDPFDTDIDQEMAVKIALESKFNPWFTFRELIRIPVQGSSEPTMFKANRANIALFWCFFNHIDFLMIQPRQTYKSGSIDSLMVYLLFIAAENLNINLITKDASLRSDNIERLKMIRDYLPHYFYRDNTEDVNNKVAVTNVFLNNRYKTSVSQKSIVGANKVARGATGPVFHIDEFAIISHLATTLPAALAAGTEARNQAREKGGYYGNIFSTTVGDRSDRDGEYAYRIMDNGTVWSEHFYDCVDRLHLIEMIKSNRSVTDEFKDSILINGTFSYRQLGRSKKWLKEAMANSRGDVEQTKRDYLNKWTTGSTYSPLSSELNEKIFNSEIEPNYTEIAENKYFLRWYCNEELKDDYLNNNFFVLSLDSSEAIGNDAIGMVLSDVTDMRTVMSANITESNLLSFAHWLGQFIIKYKNITLIPEMRSTARVIIDVLLIELPAVGIDPYKRIFNNLIDNSTKFKEAQRELYKSISNRDRDFIDKYRKEIGFVTTSEKRDFLFKNNLQLAASRAGHLVYDKVLSKEIRGLVIKNGRVDHKSSGHDDVCIAWLLNHWFLTNAKNLEQYGIKRGLVLSRVIETDDAITVTDSVELEKQSKIRSKIDSLVEDLSKSEDPTHMAKIKSDIRRLSKEVVTTDGAIYNFDDLIKRANEMKIERLKKNKGYFGSHTIDFSNR